jgi:hypothetical protein
MNWGYRESITEPSMRHLAVGLCGSKDDKFEGVV